MNNLDFNFFCSSCPKSEEYRLSNCFTNYKIKHYKAGEYIAYKGDVVKSLAIVVKGSMKTLMILDSGVSYTTVKHHAPYPFGALALFAKNNSYRAEFVALEDCITISVNREDIENQLMTCRIFLRNFIAYNTSKFDIFTTHLTILTQKTLRSRLALYIFSMSKNKQFRFDKKLEDIATYLGVERPSLSRAIAQLVEEKVIVYSRGTGEIIDVIALKNALE